MIPFAANALQCIVNGEDWRKTAKIAPSPWDFVTLLEELLATAVGHRQHAQKIWYIAHMAPEICSRQRDTQTCSSQYLATVPAGAVINIDLV